RNWRNIRSRPSSLLGRASDSVPVPLLIVVRPQSGRCSDFQRAQGDSLRRVAAERAWAIDVLETHEVLSGRARETGRRLQVIDPWDASELYKVLHRRPVAVAAPTTSRVGRNASIEPSTHNS